MSKNPISEALEPFKDNLENNQINDDSALDFVEAAKGGSRQDRNTNSGINESVNEEIPSKISRFQNSDQEIANTNPNLQNPEASEMVSDMKNGENSEDEKYSSVQESVAPISSAR